LEQEKIPQRDPVSPSRAVWRRERCQDCPESPSCGDDAAGGFVLSAGFHWAEGWWLRGAKSFSKCKEHPSGKAVLRTEFLSSENVQR